MTEEHHFQHDADQTELEKWINTGLTKVEPYSNQILMGFIAATVIAVVTIFWLRSSGEAASAGWTEFVNSEAPDDYAEVAKDHPDTSAALWSQLQAGRLFLNEGLNTALTNRETSDEQLGNAKESFENILSKTDVPAAAREEALFGLASTLEALSDGDTGPAVKAYEALLQEFPDSNHGPWAESRVEALKTGEAQNFYAWFRQQNPQPTDRPKPRDVSTPAESMLNDLKLEMLENTSESTATPSDQPKAPDLPQRIEDKPATEATPAKPADLPAEEATSAKPAEKPATEDKTTDEKATDEKATEATPEPPAESKAPEEPAPAEAPKP